MERAEAIINSLKLDDDAKARARALITGAARTGIDDCEPFVSRIAH